jgi:hypothetical protein
MKQITALNLIFMIIILSEYEMNFKIFKKFFKSLI